ncbi:MAG TPA: DUF4232 domain-containing protein [Candidatus Saccharimonadales bacterium]|nr:DUF4232 domain-containing protein [Candidatus Saccharimonadales bacterium]
MDDENKSTETNTAPEPQPMPEKPATAPAKSKTWPMLVVGLLLGAAVVGAVWYWHSNTKSTPATTTTNTTHQSTSSSGSGSTTTTTAMVDVCASSTMSMALGTTDNTAGTQYQHLVVTNTGTASCKLAGYPAVFLLDSASAVLGDGAQPVTTITPTTITLAAGAKAHTVVGFPDAGNFTDGQCTAASKTLRLYLPGTTSYLDASLAKANCPGFSVEAFSTGS